MLNLSGALAQGNDGGRSRRRPLPLGAYWVKGTFSQFRTLPASPLLPPTVNLT